MTDDLLDIEKKFVLDEEYCNYVPLSLLQRGRPEKPAICCIPGAGGVASAFLPFSNSLGPDYAVFSFQPRGIDDDLAPHSTVTAAANDYISALLEAFPTGRYLLVGHSFGGWVAFEMACHLQRLGKRVGPVILLDSEAPAVALGAGIKYNNLEALLLLIRLQEEKLEMSSGLTREHLENLSHHDQLEVLMQWMKRAGILPRSAKINVVKSLFKVFSVQVNTDYVSSHFFEGDLILAIPEKGAAEKNNQENWRNLALDFRQIQVPGDHMTMLDEENLIKVVDIAHNYT